MQTMRAAAEQQLGQPVLLTVNANLSYPLPDAPADDTIVQLQRIWTSDAAHYPVTGRKSKPLTAWTRQLLLGAEVFVGEGEAAIRAHFNDHATILGMGLRSVINTPLCDAQGKCFGTVNLLAPCAAWPEGAVPAVQSLAQQTAAAVQAHCLALQAAAAQA